MAGTRSVFVGPEAGIGPQGLAFDHFGNLLVSTQTFPFTNDTIFMFMPSAVKSTFVTGLAGPRGLAFDSAGNLFVAEIPLSGSDDILKIKPDRTWTVFASVIDGVPEYLAIQPRVAGPVFKLARVPVRLDHVASFIVGGRRNRRGVCARIKVV